jgi:spermidine/putrescine transport system ATP-binding protein
MGAAEPLLSIRNITKSFDATRVLQDVSFDVGASEFLTILGESGSGKTTLLRILAGFEQADAGEVWMGGERLDRQPANRRNVNTVFQHYALFPHLSIFENVAYGLRAKKVAWNEITRRVEATLEQMRMSEFAQRRPAQLSGGQQQRVALARALVNRPQILLLDEPLAALDANLRRHMQVELKSLQRAIGISFVFVTHDQEEAMLLSDRIALLRHGRIEQIATPREIYGRPRTAYAATFIGQTNLLRASISNGTARIGPLQWDCSQPEGSSVFSLRPEHIVVTTDHGPASGLRCKVSVIRRMFVGASEMLEADCGEGLTLMVRVAGGMPERSELTLAIAPDHIVPLAGEEA